MKKVLKEFFIENKFRFVIQIVFIMINMYLLTIPAKLIGKTIDLLYDISSNRMEIMNNMLLLVLLSILILVVRLIWKYVDTLIPRSLERITRDTLFSHFLKMKVNNIQEIKNGEIMSYFVKDISELRMACHHIFSFGPRILFTAIFAIYSMSKDVNLKLTIIAIIPLAVAAVILVRVKEYININYKKSQEKFTTLSEYLQESSDAIRTIKAYNLEDNHIEQFEQYNKEVKASNIKVNLFSTLLSVSMHTCFGLSYGLALFFGSKLVLNGSISIGDLVAFNAYIGLFVNPVSWIPPLISRIKRGQVSLKRIDEILKTEEELLIKEKEIVKKHSLGDIVINNLDFKYKGYIDKALSNINLNIKEGETIGIIGKVGSGKSTLMNLLVKLYSIPRGKISFGGIDINDIPVSVLRENICYITQENFLFSTTIKQNISLFRDEYEDEDIENSIKNAMIYDEIMSLPDKIDTVIGERGVDLSGGQKQRVVISRAFLNKSDIVIFDDTFSALDNKTEQHLLKNIKNLMNGKTCIIISNRISDIKHADRIVVMDAGEIVEMGTHKTLLKLKSHYYDFYKQQALRSDDSILS